MNAMASALNDILAALIANAAVSDIHLAEDRVVWSRGSEGLVPIDVQVPSEALRSWFAHLRTPGRDVHEYLLANDGSDDFAVVIAGVRCRANVFLSQGKLKLVLRRLAGVLPFASLGLPEILLKLTDRPRGIFFVTGPTNSGKTTTLGSIVDHLNESRALHIITLEHPVEVEHANKKSLITQRSVGPSVSDDVPTFSGGLRAALRENPNAIMVGEIRDAQTMHTALQAAATGHMVFTTLHTNGGAATIERIAGFFDGVDRVNALAELSSNFAGVLSQELLTDVSGKKVIAYEILVPTAPVCMAIRKGDVNVIHQEMDTGSSYGHVKLNTILLQLVRTGRLSREEALYRSNDPSRFGK